MTIDLPLFVMLSVCVVGTAIVLGAAIQHAIDSAAAEKVARAEALKKLKIPVHPEPSGGKVAGGRSVCARCHRPVTFWRPAGVSPLSTWKGSWFHDEEPDDDHRVRLV